MTKQLVTILYISTNHLTLFSIVELSAVVASPPNVGVSTTSCNMDLVVLPNLCHCICGCRGRILDNNDLVCWNPLPFRSLLYLWNWNAVFPSIIHGGDCWVLHQNYGTKATKMKKNRQPTSEPMT